MTKNRLWQLAKTLVRHVLFSTVFVLGLLFSDTYIIVLLSTALAGIFAFTVNV